MNRRMRCNLPHRRRSEWPERRGTFRALPVIVPDIYLFYILDAIAQVTF
jgi:hypothetical protein